MASLFGWDTRGKRRLPRLRAGKGFVGGSSETRIVAPDHRLPGSQKHDLYQCYETAYASQEESQQFSEWSQNLAQNGGEGRERVGYPWGPTARS